MQRLPIVMGETRVQTQISRVGLEFGLAKNEDTNFDQESNAM